MSSTFNVGDKVFYVNKKTDSEVEGYIYKDMGNNVYTIKIRDGASFGFFPEDRLTKIEPTTWESLEENLKKYNLEMDTEDEQNTSLNSSHN